jgi:5-methylcytosine-specific restriction endonuclease McrA
MQTSRCWVCWLKLEAATALGTTAAWVKLEELWFNQKASCAYTGVHLIPGINASIDHKIPRSRKGLDIITNLHWVDKTVNMKKFTRTHEEFLGAKCQ